LSLNIAQHSNLPSDDPAIFTVAIAIAIIIVIIYNSVAVA
jgi:hypothetical protein